MPQEVNTVCIETRMIYVIFEKVARFANMENQADSYKAVICWIWNNIAFEFHKEFTLYVYKYKYIPGHLFIR